jgi:branched-chain amino acid transport system substrate-binding protein
MTLQIGVCLSLTGRYERFGRQAAEGLNAWQGLVGDGVSFRVEDDRSDRDRLPVVLKQVARDCDLLLGPYSTELMRQAGHVMSEFDRILWNHGGSGDDVQALCPGRIVSVLAPTSRYAVPFVHAQSCAATRSPLWVVRGRGRFARQVAEGAIEEARRAGLEVVEKRADEEPWMDSVPEVWDLFSVGTFEDDVAIVNQARAGSRTPRALCSVAAGVRDFASMVHEPDGTFGIAQWFPGRDEPVALGPAERDFVKQYRRVVGSWPDYPAVQAAAAAMIAARCSEIAGSLRPGELWAAARELETSTMFGSFGIDGRTGVQRKHTPVLLQWRGSEQLLVS